MLLRFRCGNARTRKTNSPLGCRQPPILLWKVVRLSQEIYGSIDPANAIEANGQVAKAWSLVKSTRGVLGSRANHNIAAKRPSLGKRGEEVDKGSKPLVRDT